MHCGQTRSTELHLLLLRIRLPSNKSNSAVHQCPHLLLATVSHIWDHVDVDVFRKVPAYPQDLRIHCFAKKDCLLKFLYLLLLQVVFATHSYGWHALIHCCSFGFSASHWWQSVRCNSSYSNHVQTLSISCLCCDAVRSSSYIIGFTVAPISDDIRM